MRWEKVKLGNIAEFSNGVNFDKSAYAPGVKLISVSNFGNRFYPDYSELPEISADVVKENDYLQHGDIVFVRSNGNKELVGRCMLIDNPPTHTTYSGFCIRARVKDTKRFNPKFLTYHFKHDGFRIAIAGNAVGANIQNLSQGRLSAYIAHIPPIETQRRIADVLSAYDDLIENNRKQIKLLEEAAQRLYKEWFVDLRFPGHEHTRIVDGIPEGWKNGCLSQIAEFKRGKTITKAQIKPGTIPVVAGGLEPAYYHNVANTKAPVITISASGANAGFTRMYHTDVFASDCSFIDKNTCACLPFVYCFLINHKSELDSLQKGSAQPHVYAKDINALQLCLPNSNLLNKFCDFSKRLFLKIGLLEHQNTDLTQARDHLLPKLMGGEMEM